MVTAPGWPARAMISRLPLVVLGVQHLVLDPGPSEHFGELLVLLDGDGPHQHRLALRVELLDLLEDGLEFLPLGPVDHVRVVRADHGLVGGDDHDVQLVDLLELRRLGVGRSGHAGQLLVHAEVVLEGDGGQGLVFVLDLDLFLGLQGLVEPVAVAAPRHEPARELVDDDHLAVLDDVVHVPLEEDVGLQGLVDVVEQFDVAGVVEVVDLHELLDRETPSSVRNAERAFSSIV